MPIEITTLESDPVTDAQVLASVEGPSVGPSPLTEGLRRAIGEQLAHPGSRGWDGAVDDARNELAVRLAGSLDGCTSCITETVDACERAIRAELEG